LDARVTHHYVGQCGKHVGRAQQAEVVEKAAIFRRMRACCGARCQRAGHAGSVPHVGLRAPARIKLHPQSLRQTAAGPCAVFDVDRQDVAAAELRRDWNRERQRFLRLGGQLGRTPVRRFPPRLLAAPRSKPWLRDGAWLVTTTSTVTRWPPWPAGCRENTAPRIRPARSWHDPRAPAHRTAFRARPASDA